MYKFNVSNDDTKIVLKIQKLILHNEVIEALKKYCTYSTVDKIIEHFNNMTKKYINNFEFEIHLSECIHNDYIFNCNYNECNDFFYNVELDLDERTLNIKKLNLYKFIPQLNFNNLMPDILFGMPEFVNYNNFMPEFVNCNDDIFITCNVSNKNNIIPRYTYFNQELFNYENIQIDIPKKICENIKNEINYMYERKIRSLNYISFGDVLNIDPKTLMDKYNIEIINKRNKRNNKYIKKKIQQRLPKHSKY